MAITDNRTCNTCLILDEQPFRGTELRSFFPWQNVITADQILPAVHPNCLLGNTLINTAEGLRAVADVEVGDLVQTHRGRYMPVVQIHKNWYDGILVKLYDSWITANHPILSAEGWMCADHLHKGESICRLEPAPSKSENSPTALRKNRLFSSILRTEYKGFVHNISVAEDETYTIGHERVIAHNCRCTLLRITSLQDYLDLGTQPFNFVSNIIGELLKHERERFAQEKAEAILGSANSKAPCACTGEERQLCPSFPCWDPDERARRAGART
jgi:hypothetical protein